MGVRVERLHDIPAGAAELVSDSERSGLRFVRKLVEDWISAENRFDRPGEALFGAFLDRRMVGVCGLNIDPYVTDDGVGRLRHLYVLADFRHAGVARALMAHVLAAGRGRFDHLRLRTNNPAAARLYESFGFQVTPESADSTHVLPLAR